MMPRYEDPSDKGSVAIYEGSPWLASSAICKGRTMHPQCQMQAVRQSVRSWRLPMDSCWRRRRRTLRGTKWKRICDLCWWIHLARDIFWTWILDGVWTKTDVNENWCQCLFKFYIYVRKSVHSVFSNNFGQLTELKTEIL